MVFGKFFVYLELNSLLPIAITVFRLIAPPLTRRLWRMALISVTNSSVTIEERPCQDIVKSATLSWLSQFFWCLIFQYLTDSFLKRNFGYFFDAYLLASGLSYFHTWLAVSFFIFSGRTCRFFLCSCFPWRLFSSLAAEIRLSVKAGMGNWRME